MDSWYKLIPKTIHKTSTNVCQVYVYIYLKKRELGTTIDGHASSKFAPAFSIRVTLPPTDAP